MLVAAEERARKFAEGAHAGQTYGAQPYTTHLEAVRAILGEFWVEGPLLVAAWLHDTVEDTPSTREEVAAEFGEEVAALVWAVTGVGATRPERLANAYGKLRAHPAALPLKLADRIANVEASRRTNPAMLAKYRAEAEAFNAALRAPLEGSLPKEPVASMWARLDEALWCK